MALVCWTAWPGVIFVAESGNDNNTGQSWAAARRTVAAALAQAQNGDEIRVAQGAYVERISLKRGVRLLGGWSGIADERDAGRYASVLDGGNAGCVVQCEDPAAGEETVLDGFVVQNGKGLMKGGIFLAGCSPTIANNTIRKNFSEGEGAGICCVDGADALIVNNVIRDNTAFGLHGDGGGICCMGHTSGSSPRILGNTIYYNIAFQNGGGICSKSGSAPVIAGNRIAMNVASLVPSYKTGVNDEDPERPSVGAGGIACLEGGGATIRNNLIVGNGGLYAGGILIYDAGDGLQVVNNTIVGNSPNGIQWANSAPTIVNNIIASNGLGVSRLLAKPGNPPVFKANCVFGNGVDFNGFDAPGAANGNLPADPRLASIAVGNFHLQPNSPCRDAGDPGFSQAGETDVFGKSRVLGGRVDIGADESDGTVWTVNPVVVRVRPGGNDNGDGSSWAKAKQHVAAAIAAAEAVGGGEIWVAEGTYSENNLSLRPFVYLYGGFAGNEINREDRQVAAHATVLDGGQGGFVLRPIGGWQLSAVDGFTVTHGRQTGTSDLGGGLSILLSGPTVKNNRIVENTSPVGGGIGLYASTAVIVDNVISQNSAGSDGQGWGGGIYATHSTPFIQNNDIGRNKASDGGGIYFTATKPYILRNRIHDNLGHGISGQNSRYAVWFNGDIVLIGQNAIYRNFTEANGAGIGLLFCPGQIIDNLIAYNATGGTQGGGVSVAHTSELDAPVTLAHNTIVGNQCNYLKPWGMVFQGAGIFIFQQGAPGIILANNIVAFNQTGIFNYAGLSAVGSPLMLHNLVYGNNGYDYQTSYLQAGPLNHPTDLNVDPQFVNANAFDFHLSSSSPCVDGGDPAYGLYSDLEGVPRCLDGKGAGTAVPDMGAFEVYRTTVGVPAGPAASKGVFADRIRLTWSPVSTATHYEVWRRPAGTPSTAAVRVGETQGTQATTFDDWNAPAGGDYDYFVKAKLAIYRLTVVSEGGDSNYAFEPQSWVSSASADARGGLAAASPYEIWRRSHFSAGDLADSGISGDLGDPDHDGRPNWLEYGAGSDPKIADTTRVAWAGTWRDSQSGRTYPAIHWRFAKPAPADVTPVVEFSPSLVPGSWTQSLVRVVETIDRGSYLEYVVRASAPIGDADRGFLRLSFSR